MNFKKNIIEGSYEVDLNRIGDDIGFFSRIYCSKEFKKKKYYTKHFASEFILFKEQRNYKRHTLSIETFF